MCENGVGEFSGCHVSVTDEQRRGRPSTSADLVPAVEETVCANRRVLLKDLEEQFNLLHGTIWDIVHERSGYRKVRSRWVRRQLTEDHKKNRMGASLTHLHFNEHGEDFLEQIITERTEHETWDFISSPTQKKKHLRAKRFKSHDDVKHEVQTWLRGQDPTFYRQGFEKWISRLDECLNRECDYVKK